MPKLISIADPDGKPAYGVWIIISAWCFWLIVMLYQLHPDYIPWPVCGE